MSSTGEVRILFNSDRTKHIALWSIKLSDYRDPVFQTHRDEVRWIDRDIDGRQIRRRARPTS